MERLLDKNEFHKVIGEIYKITNLITNKMYIGQTRSHYLNNGKYRPFGYMGRFKKHLNEASRININCSCRYLNSTINKYGATNFKCELITTCYINDLDYYEKKMKQADDIIKKLKKEHTDEIKKLKKKHKSKVKAMKKIDSDSDSDSE